MRLLLDTHVLIWNINNQKALSETALALIDDPTHDKFISLARTIRRINMTKNELVEKLALETGFTKVQAKLVLEIV